MTLFVIGNSSLFCTFTDDLGYDPENIVVLVDNDNEPDHVQPTRENVICQMRKLVEDARAGDQFFFLGMCCVC